MKKISVVTGSRAEYGLLRPLLTAFKNNKHFTLDLIVTGMHLVKAFGYTVEEIKKDGFTINAQIPCEIENEKPNSMAISIGKTIAGVSNHLVKSKPDILLVLGDRAEILGGVISAAYLNIPIAHLSGGDTSWGGLDESARHAITKLSHIHFPFTKGSAKRIQKLGEDAWRIFPVGSTGLDDIIKMQFLSDADFEHFFKLDAKKTFLLMIQHPVSTEPDKAEEQITESLEAIKELMIKTIIIYPNSDLGGRKMIAKIKEYESLPFVQTYPSLPRDKFLNLMNHASVMIGNSSSGIAEAPSFHLPVINIGDRQIGRERGNNIIDVEHDRVSIIHAIKKALSDGKFKQIVRKSVNPYGDGQSVQRIVKILETTKFDTKWIKKKITY